MGRTVQVGEAAVASASERLPGWVTVNVVAGMPVVVRVSDPSSAGTLDVIHPRVMMERFLTPRREAATELVAPQLPRVPRDVVLR